MSAAVDRTEKPCLHPRANHQHGHHLAYEKDGCRCTPCTAANSRQDKAVRYRTATATHTYVPAHRTRAHLEQLLEVLALSQVEQRSGVHRTAIRVLLGSMPGRPASRRITRATEAALLAVAGDRLGSEQHGLVDGTGTRRRFRALVALGWPIRHLSARTGFSSRTAWMLTRDDIGTELIRIHTRDEVRRVYDELSLTIPPASRVRTRARHLAAAKGWVPPLAFDDDTIDDPDVLPQHLVVSDTAGVDHVAVERALRGERTDLTRAERWIAVERLAAQGMSDAQVANRLGVSDKTVLRDRQDLGIDSQWRAA